MQNWLPLEIRKSNKEEENEEREELEDNVEEQTGYYLCQHPSNYSIIITTILLMEVAHLIRTPLMQYMDRMESMDSIATQLE